MGLYHTLSVQTMLKKCTGMTPSCYTNPCRHKQTLVLFLPDQKVAVPTNETLQLHKHQTSESLRLLSIPVLSVPLQACKIYENCKLTSTKSPNISSAKTLNA